MPASTRQPISRFPEEAFVLEALERHFAGWELDRSRFDLEFKDSTTGFTWIVEVKGDPETSAAHGFHKALGQLLVQMSSGPDASYGIAMPDTRAFAQERRAIPKWVREKLNLYWFVVDRAGEVQAIPPHSSSS